MGPLSEEATRLINGKNKYENCLPGTTTLGFSVGLAQGLGFICTYSTSDSGAEASPRAADAEVRLGREGPTSSDSAPETAVRAGAEHRGMGGGGMRIGGRGPTESEEPGISKMVLDRFVEKSASHGGLVGGRFLDSFPTSSVEEVCWVLTAFGQG